jgi:crotonobetainyl-CoA:carnitine CoA-transferase CaiB-like acyl-CoA transferase
MSASLPLEGIRVLDLSRVVAGPYCSMTLGDLGADVIKVENPDGGDDTRRFGPPFVAGESAYFLCLNRNKRSVTLDLKDPAGQRIARDLAARSDVLVENLRPGALARFGLDPSNLRERDPRLITCSLSAFGTTGPYCEEPGYDFVMQALTGLMSVTGRPDDEPMKVGVALIDVLAGLYAATAILGALRVRDLTGRGQHVDLSLFESGLAGLINVASTYLVAGEHPHRYGNAHPSIVPYQVFPTRDRPFVVGVANDRQFALFSACVGHPEWAADARFATNPARVANRAELVRLIESALRERDAAEWEEKLRAAGVPCAPINDVADAFEHPQAQALGVVARIAHPAAGLVPLVRPPFHLSETPPTIRRPPPRLGEHTEEVLGEILGMGEVDNSMAERSTPRPAD